MDERLSNYFADIPEHLQEAVGDCVHFAHGQDVEHHGQFFLVLAITFIEIVKGYERATGQKLIEIERIPVHAGNESIN